MARSKPSYLLPAPWPYKIFLFCIFVPVYAFFYIYPNFHPPYPPVALTQFPFEASIPLIPWTFLIYVSDYALVAWAIWLLQDRVTMHRFCRRIFLIIAMGGTVFFFYPTLLVREPFHGQLTPLIRWLMDLVRELDAPTNCFPSMHCAFTALAAWSMRKQKPKIVAAFAIWSFLIFVSVLTTKQHYFIDILGGIGLTAFGCWFERMLWRTPLNKLFRDWENTSLWNVSLLRISR